MNKSWRVPILIALWVVALLAFAVSVSDYLYNSNNHPPAIPAAELCIHLNGTLEQPPCQPFWTCRGEQGDVFTVYDDGSVRFWKVGK